MNLPAPVNTILPETMTKIKQFEAALNQMHLILRNISVGKLMFFAHLFLSITRGVHYAGTASMNILGNNYEIVKSLLPILFPILNFGTHPLLHMVGAMLTSRAEELIQLGNVNPSWTAELYGLKRSIESVWNDDMQLPSNTFNKMHELYTFIGPQKAANMALYTLEFAALDKIVRHMFSKPVGLPTCVEPNTRQITSVIQYWADENNTWVKNTIPAGQMHETRQILQDISDEQTEQAVHNKMNTMHQITLPVGEVIKTPEGNAMVIDRLGESGIYGEQTTGEVERDAFIIIDINGLVKSGKVRLWDKIKNVTGDSAKSVLPIILGVLQGVEARYETHPAAMSLSAGFAGLILGSGYYYDRTPANTYMNDTHAFVLLKRHNPGFTLWDVVTGEIHRIGQPESNEEKIEREMEERNLEEYKRSLEEEERNAQSEVTRLQKAYNIARRRAGQPKRGQDTAEVKENASFDQAVRDAEYELEQAVDYLRSIQRRMNPNALGLEQTRRTPFRVGQLQNGVPQRFQYNNRFYTMHTIGEGFRRNIIYTPE